MNINFRNKVDVKLQKNCPQLKKKNCTTSMPFSSYGHCKDSFLFQTAPYFAILEISFSESEGNTLETLFWMK